MSLFRQINNQINKVDDDSVLTQEMVQLVTFQIADEEFGIDILKVQEIIRMTDITRVPNSHDYVVGVINLRGKIIPIIDLRSRLEMPSIELTISSRIIVIESDGVVIGLVVDGVNQVTTVDKAVAEPPPPMVGGVDAGFITSIFNLTERIIILLDLKCVIENVDTHELSEA